MRAVFLDFDGVLNRKVGRWESDLVGRLNQITDETGAKIVVHSSWRWGRTLDQIRYILTTYHHGVPVTGEVIDLCPVPARYKWTPAGLWVSDADFAIFRGKIATNDERAIAIQKWLNKHPGVSRYVILDDSDALGHFIGTPEFIQTDAQVGLTDAHVQRAIRHLGVIEQVSDTP